MYERSKLNFRHSLRLLIYLHTHLVFSYLLIRHSSLENTEASSDFLFRSINHLMMSSMVFLSQTDSCVAIHKKKQEKNYCTIIYFTHQLRIDLHISTCFIKFIRTVRVVLDLLHTQYFLCKIWPNSSSTNKRHVSYKVIFSGKYILFTLLNRNSVDRRIWLSRDAHQSSFSFLRY